MVDSSSVLQFLRYASVGVTSNLLLYLAYLAITGLGMGHKLAMTLLYASGVVLTFLANRSWSFGDNSVVHKSFPRYVIVYGLGYLVNLGVLWLGVDRLHLPHEGVQAVAVIVVAVSLFLMLRYWVFARTVAGSSVA